MLIIYTFNAFDPDVISTKVTWWTGGWNKSDLEKVVRADKLRWPHREECLITLIRFLLRDKCIICLQEVNDEFLRQLKLIFSNKISWTKSRDKITYINRTTKEKKIIEKEQYRVTLVSKELKIINFRDILFNTNETEKAGLITFVKYNEYIIPIINVHFHWKSTMDDITGYANVINDLNFDKYIICGDMNKPLSSPYIKAFINKCNINPVETSVRITGPETRDDSEHDESTVIPYEVEFPNVKLSSVDHILTYGDIKINNIGARRDVMIMFPDVKSLINLGKSEKQIADEWIERRNCKDLSDHALVYGEIIFK